MKEFDISANAFNAILRKSGDVATSPPLTTDERSFVLALHVYGLIGNMGLTNLFEHEIDDDPGYRFSRRAFHDIGAKEAAQVFDEAAQLCYFPNGEQRRWKKNVSTLKRLDELDDRFLTLDAEIERCLTRFVEDRPALLAAAVNWKKQDLSE